MTAVLDTATPCGVELDEAGIPPHLLPRARAWFTREVRALERAHGDHWPAVKDWLVDYLRAELRELVAKEVGRGV
jgi:hypothetical protein